jgi:predicted metal-dependent TIM-barrel fold hydrolase
MYSRTTDDYCGMFDAGIRACVEPSFWLGSARRYAGTFFDYFQLVLEFETVRSRRFGIDHYAAISVNPKEADNASLSREVISGMDEYLNHPRCVAIGEIGFDKITGNEEEIFAEQLQIAHRKNLPAIVHLAHFEKVNAINRTLSVIRNERFPEERILIDHNTEESMPIARKTGCWTGMTVYPISKLTPERASSIIKQFGSEKMIIDGSADWGVSDPLSLVKVCDYMKKNGHEQKTIDKILFDNPNDFYSQTPKWKPDFNLTPIDPGEFQR